MLGRVGSICNEQKKDKAVVATHLNHSVKSMGVYKPTDMHFRRIVIPWTKKLQLETIHFCRIWKVYHMPCNVLIKQSLVLTNLSYNLLPDRRIIALHRNKLFWNRVVISACFPLFSKSAILLNKQIYQNLISSERKKNPLVTDIRLNTASLIGTIKAGRSNKITGPLKVQYCVNISLAIYAHKGRFRYCY